MTTPFGSSEPDTHWYVPDGINNFISVDTGCALKNGYVVIVESGYEAYAHHRSSYEARKNLIALAKKYGANALLDVHVNCSPYDSTARGRPAIVARLAERGMLRDELLEWAHLRYLNWCPRTVPTTKRPPMHDKNLDVPFWKQVLKLIFWTGIAIMILVWMAG